MLNLGDAMPLSPSTAGDGCAVLVRRRTGQWGPTCTEPPNVDARWRFTHPRPHVDQIRLCAQHRGALAHRNEYLGERAIAGVTVGPLYDAAAED